MKDKLKNIIPTDLLIITANYQVLHFDEEPILFTGTNAYGNRIIGSLVEDDDEALISWCFHIIVDPGTYTDFRKRKVSYLQLLKNSHPVYLIERSFDGTSTKVYFLSFDEILEEYLPMEDSFCPEQKSKSTLTYSMRLKGALADANVAVPREISNIQTTFATQLESNLALLKNIVHEPPVVLQTAYTSGSFTLNFEIQVKTDNMFIKDEAVGTYVNGFLEYCTEYLPDEADRLYEQEVGKLPFLGHLIGDFERLYSQAGVTLPVGYKEKVRDEVKKTSESLAEMTEAIGEHFTTIEITNGTENPRAIACLDINFKKTIESVVESIQSKTQKVEEDPKPKRYEIYVYHLNKESRTGNAMIINETQDKTMSRPKIKISGDKPLDSTKYTESLHLNKPISVLAKAKKVDDKFRSLDIEFEEE
jgi:hypothetical protein